MKKSKKSRGLKRRTSYPSSQLVPTLRLSSASTVASIPTNDTLDDDDKTSAGTATDRRPSIVSDTLTFDIESAPKTGDEAAGERRSSVVNDIYFSDTESIYKNGTYTTREKKFSLTNDTAVSDSESVFKGGADTTREKRQSLTNDLVVSDSESVFRSGAETYRRQGKRYRRISCGLEITPLPVALFRRIFLFVPAIDLVRHCSLVCKSWLAMCRDSLLWQKKCEQGNKFIPEVAGLPAKSFMMAYFKDPYSRNLLRNTHALDGLRFWNQPRGYQIINVEDYPDGANPILDHIPAEDIGGRIQNWVTSYRYTYMSQSLVLPEEGVSKIVLDELRPAIRVSAWCSAHCDSGAKFYMLVRLIDKTKKEAGRFEKELDLTYECLRKVWHKVEYIFTDYKPGVRKVILKMGGTDTQGWRGLYGAKFTLPCVCFDFNPVLEEC